MADTSQYYAAPPWNGLPTMPGPSANDRAHASVMAGQVSPNSGLGQTIEAQYQGAATAPAYDWGAGGGVSQALISAIQAQGSRYNPNNGTMTGEAPVYAHYANPIEAIRNWFASQSVAAPAATAPVTNGQIAAAALPTFAQPGAQPPSPQSMAAPAYAPRGPMTIVRAGRIEELPGAALPQSDPASPSAMPKMQQDFVNAMPTDAMKVLAGRPGLTNEQAHQLLGVATQHQQASASPQAQAQSNFFANALAIATLQNQHQIVEDSAHPGVYAAQPLAASQGESPEAYKARVAAQQMALSRLQLLRSYQMQLLPGMNSGAGNMDFMTR